MHRCLAFAAAVTATLAACKGNDSAPWPVDAGRSSLVATPASLPADGTAAATLRATVRDVRGNPVAGAVVAFSASGEGNALSAVEAVTAEDGTATVTLRSALVGWKTVSAAVGGAVFPDSPVVEFHAWTDVDGVVATFLPIPLSGVAVAAGTGNVWTWRTTTDAAGRFSLRRVRLPYDLVAVHPDGGRAVLYVGLTRPDPTASFQQGGVRTTSTVHLANPTVTITCSVGGCPGAGTMFADAGIGTFGTMTFLGSKSLAVPWVGGESAVARVGALFVGNTDYPSEDWWYASSEIPVAEGGTPAVALDLEPAVSPPLTVTVSSAAGVAPRDANLAVRYGRSGILGVWWQRPWAEATTDGELTVVLPMGLGISPRLSVGGDATSGRSVAWWEGSPAVATSVVLELPAPPAQLAPAEGAADIVPGTEFLWTSSPDVVSAVSLTCGDTILTAFIADARFELPDLAELGFSWSGGAACTWTVQAGPRTDVDDAASQLGRPWIGLGRVGSAFPRGFTMR
jgi:hypothetical protein